MADQEPTTDSSADSKGGATTAPRRRGLLNRLLEIVIIAVIALSLSAGIRHFVGQMFVIPSGSMENTLQVRDRVIVSKISDFHRGSVVVFKDPGDWVVDAPAPRTGVGKVLEQVGLLPSTSANYLVKRVIGLPGDTVKCCDKQGRMTVNGVALDETSYLYSDASGQVKPANVPFEVVVPAGRLFMMGDHRNDSDDSRCHLADTYLSGQPMGAIAFVPEGDVVGPVVAVAFPLNRLKTLSVPDTFKAIPDATGTPPAQATIIPAGVGC